MSRRPHAFRRTLAALAGSALLLAPPPVAADTCSGLGLGALSPVGAGTDPSGVAVGDFNRDGRLDVAVANRSSSDVSVLLGNGGGGFTPGPGSPISVPGSVPADLAVGDLDGDGLLDIVLAYGTAAQARVLQGLGTGGFSLQTPFPLNAIPSRIYLADFTNDADLDLVVLAETGQRLLLYAGDPGLGFNAGALSNFDLTPVEQPSGAAPVDFDRDGKLDLAVAMRNQNWVRVYRGLGAAGLGGSPTTLTLAATGPGPRDVVAGDINRDGFKDLVTANSGSGSVSVLLNAAGSSLTPQNAVPMGGTPLRVALVDLDRDGILDLAVDDSLGPRVRAFRGDASGPDYFETPATDAALPLPITTSLAVAVGDFVADGRADLVTLAPGERLAVVVENRSGTPCARASFAAAPRSYLAVNGPVSTAAADFDGDGRQDLVVATTNDSFVRILRNVNGEFSLGTSIGPFLVAPRGVAVTDIDFDGDMDVVVALGDAGSGQVQVLLGNGTGGLALGASQPSGVNTAAVAIGDFNGDGAPDVAAASEGTGQVFRFLGNGAGALGGGASFTVGSAPRALVAADLDTDGKVDLAVANFSGNNVSILGGNGDGTFSTGLTLAVGTNPQGIAAAHLNGDTQLDLVTADNGSGQVSVILGNGGGGYLGATAYPVGTNPTAVALLQLDGDPRPDIAVTAASATPTLSILRNNGAGAFVLASDSPVRQSPQAITPVDADSDGLLDLAVPCRTAQAVVVLVNRPPGPPVLQAAPRYAAGDRPRAAAAADLDADGDLDLAVASLGSNVVSLLRGDGAGGFNPAGTLAASQAEAVAVADFNLDGKLDIAASAPGSASVEVFNGTGGGAFGAPASIPAGGAPDDLVAGDFDRDGDLDLAVCDKQTAGLVRILRNNGPGAGLGTFSAGPTVPVGQDPTAIVAGDFDRDGDLDLAVANNASANVVVLANSGGSFTLVQTLGLSSGDTSPVALAAADFNADGALDLAAAAFFGDRVHVYRNDTTGNFATPEGTFDAPRLIASLSAADLNLDGRPDLLVVAGGLSVFRGRGGMDFDPPQTVVAAYQPVATLAGDFNRDGRPDVVVANEGSDDVSVFTSNACQPQHLELTVQPNACSVGSPPFFLDAQVKAFDDGGNLASCATNTVTPSIVPGTGDPGASLAGGGPLPLVAGVASWTSGTSLSIDRSGRRYRLQFQAGGLAPAQSRGFTLGPESIEILGPASVCPSSFGVYSLMPDPGFDSYEWSVDGVPHSFNPTATLTNPPIVLDQFHALTVTARIDACDVTATPRSIYFGNLASVTLVVLGASSVCVDCIGGSAKANETGGGTYVRQWGYRTTSTTGAITPLVGETGETYTLKGASFPGPGTYYVVVTSTPGCGLTMVSNEWTVTVVAGGGTGEVLHLAASSRGGPSTGENKLLWVNTAAPLEVLIRWNKAPDGTTSCVPPSSPTSPPNNPPATSETSIMAPAADAKDDFVHAGLVINTAYCYSVFVRTGSGWSPGRTVKARPFDSTTRPGSSVKWAYATGGTAVAPPTVSALGILAMSNDRTVHALTRGSAGGDWPINWMPTPLVGVAHNRSPVVPFNVALGGATVLFAADDAGFVHAVNALNGSRPWPAQGPVLSMTGAPGGMFTQYSGILDGLIVGTRDVNVDNQLRLLNLADGALLEAYMGAGSPGPLGPINGSPAIDYPTRRVYFASHKRTSGHTLFCVELAAAAPFFTWRWSRDLGNITGSPVLRGGRVIVGTDAGQLVSVDAMTGLDDHTYSTLDGPVKGFPFPDRRGDDLIFATNTKVWSVSDDGSVMTKNWEWTQPLLNPSIVLYRPTTNFVYVGSGNGELYELDFTGATSVIAPTHKLQVLGGGQGQVGAPSLDIGTAPPLLLVGSEPGVVYALEVPFP